MPSPLHPCPAAGSAVPIAVEGVCDTGAALLPGDDPGHVAECLRTGAHRDLDPGRAPAAPDA